MYICYNMLNAVNSWMLFFSVLNFSLTTAQKYSRFQLSEFRVGGVVSNYEAAETECSKDKAVIASLKTKEVTVEVRKFIAAEIKNGLAKPYAFYIGLKRIAPHNKSSSFQWIDDKTLLSLSYSNWQNTFPNNDNADCVLMGSITVDDPLLKWRDLPCVSEARFLCERVPENIRITPDGSFHRFQAAEYFFGPAVESYADAEADCVSKAGNLAILSKRETYDFVVKEIEYLNLDVAPFSYYIGLRRISPKNASDSFRWASGASLANGFSKWHVGEPTNREGNENCVTLGWLEIYVIDYDWRDVVCSSVARYICQLADTNSGGIVNFISFGDYRYYFGPPVKNFIVAEDRCKSLNATIVTIKNETVQEFLLSEIGKINFTSFPFSFYLGLERINTNKNDSAFKWIDETLLTDTPGVSQWLEDNPDNEGFNENCVIMGWIYQLDRNFTWLDVKCNTLSRFICEKSKLQDAPVFDVNEVLKIIASIPPGYLASAAIGFLVAVCVGIIIFIQREITIIRRKIKAYKEKQQQQKALLAQPQDAIGLSQSPRQATFVESTYFETIGNVESTIPETPGNVLSTNPETPGIVDSTNPETPATVDATSPETPATVDATSPETPATVDASNPETPENVDSTNPEENRV